jgi:hypothetical protein
MSNILTPSVAWEHDDSRCTHEIKPSTAMAKALKKKTLFISKLDLNLRKKLVQCYN